MTTHPPARPGPEEEQKVLLDATLPDRRFGGTHPVRELAALEPRPTALLDTGSEPSD